ncbi:MAG: hypothetical protein ACYCSI_13090, partial [Solirubrobacteraceae bacterium]
APTARYEQLAALGSRFAGQGPTLFTDFDEYSLYVLRALQVSGPDFLYVPRSLNAAAHGHGGAVDLEHARPSALRGYRLIVTRRDPVTGRPPAAYQLVWHDSYYDVWRRRPGARTADLAVSLSSHTVRCGVVARIAALAQRRGAELVADPRPQLQRLPLSRARLPHEWSIDGPELLMPSPGRLTLRFHVHRSGHYDLWLRGEAMPTLRLQIDGRRIGSIADAVTGAGASPNTMLPIAVRLGAGEHILTIARAGFELAPGNGGEAYLEGVFLTPTGSGGSQRLLTVPASRWHELCGRRLNWIEAVPAASDGKLGGSRAASLPRRRRGSTIRVDDRIRLDPRTDRRRAIDAVVATTLFA